MGFVKEKVAYLRGLADGLNVQDETNKKLFAAIIEALDALADGVEENEAALAEMDECVDDIYDALDELEDDACCCGCEDDDDESFDEDDFVEVECPHCGEIIYFDQEMLASESSLICPNCNQDVITELDDTDD